MYKILVRDVICLANQVVKRKLQKEKLGRPQKEKPLQRRRKSNHK